MTSLSTPIRAELPLTAFGLSPASIQVVAFNNEKNEDRPLREFVDQGEFNVAHIGTN